MSKIIREDIATQPGCPEEADMCVCFPGMERLHGPLTWTAIGNDEGQVSAFVKLTAEELAECQARGIGK